MTELDALPFAPTEPESARSTVTSRPCRHRRDWRTPLPGGGWECRCTHVVTPETIRRAKSSIRAGKDAERQIAKDTGGRRVGHLGGPIDVLSPVPRRFAIQSKRVVAPGRDDERARRATFPEWIWDELRKLPTTGGDVPALIVSDKPGTRAGGGRRSLVVVDYRDFRDLYGELAE